MNTKQEIVDAMNRENDGRAPPALFSQTGTISLMESSGASWPDANYDMDKMIRLALQPSEQLGFATARIPFDITAEAERHGCEVAKGDAGRQPMVTGSPWMSEIIGEPPELMPVDEFIQGGRVKLYLDTAEKLSKEHPELFLTACMVGPIEVANHMLGMENFVMNAFMDPDTTLKWASALTPYQCGYAKALSQCCDNIFVICEGAEEVLPPDLSAAFFPFEAEVFHSIKDAFSVVHVCGETGTVMDTLATLGATAISVECKGDPQAIMDRLGDKIVVAGGVNPIDTLMQGTPEDVIAAAKKADAAGYDIIMPECGVPPQTANENLKALSSYRDH